MNFNFFPAFLNLLLLFSPCPSPPETKKTPNNSSLHSLQLGSLEPLSKELLPRAALALRQRTSESRKLLISAVEASSAAAALLEAAASSLEAGVASALPVPVFASLGLPAIAGCFRRAAEPHRKETERVRKKVVAAADAAVEEWRRRRGKGGGGEEGRMKKGSPSSSESLNLLRSQLTVVISAWKLQALLGPGVVFIAPAAATGGGGRASGAVGSPGAGVAAELAGVKAEMEGF